MARNVRAPPQHSFVTVALRSYPRWCRFLVFLVSQPTLDRMITTRAVAEATEPASAPPTAAVPEPSALPRLAAVDIGTNSVRLVVAEIQPDGTYRVLDEDREMTILGRGLAETGKLATETMEHSLQTLGRMKAIAEGFGVQDLRAIATSAVREASNGARDRKSTRLNSSH